MAIDLVDLVKGDLTTDIIQKTATIPPNDTEQGRAKNRRLELMVVKR